MPVRNTKSLSSKWISDPFGAGGRDHAGKREWKLAEITGESLKEIP